MTIGPSRMSAQKVLSLRELLEQIFEVFVAAKDTKTLLIARKVCRTWRAECFFALRKLRHSLPIINGRGQVGIYWKPLATFLKQFPEQCSLPLSIVIREWSPEVVYFLNAFDQDIVSVTLSIGNNWTGFGDLGKDHEFHLPGLKDSVLSLEDRYTNPLTGPLTDSDVKDIFTLWNTLTGNALRILHCGLSLAQKETDFDQSCLQVPRRLTHFSFAMNHMPLVENLAKTTFWPKLQKVEIHKLNHLEEPLQSLLFSNQRSTLQTLEISGAPGEHSVRLTEMASLKEIVIKGPAITFESERQPISSLLPKLTAIQGMKDATMRCLTKRGPPFKNVISVDYFQEVDGRLEAAKMMLTFVEYFPNLKVLSLEWPSSRVGAAALPKVYEHLSNLESLSIAVAEITTYCDINRLITGLSRNDVPYYIDDFRPCSIRWRTILDGKTNAVTNLKKLKQFKLVWREVSGSHRLAHLWEDFVFTAAFLRMPTLQKLHFEDVYVSDRCAVVMDWKKLGKELVVWGC